MLYLTPERYRISGYGHDLDDLEDVELRSILTRASEMVNEYCLVSNRPQRHDFRGGTITDEHSSWRLGNSQLPGQRRVMLNHRPVRSVQSLRINVTNNQYVAFDASQLFVTESWAEVVSLAYTSVGLFGGGLLPSIGLANPVAYVSYTYGYTFTETGETLEQTDASLYRAMNQWWDATDTPAVYRDGVVVSAGEYSIDYDEGTVTFDEPQPADTVVRVDYSYRLPPAIAEATGLIATELLGDRRTAARGLIGLAEIQVGEVRLRRESFRGSTASKAGPIPDRAQLLLAPYRQRSVA